MNLEVTYFQTADKLLDLAAPQSFLHGFPRQTWKENISALKLATKGLWLDIFRGIQHCGMIDMIVVSSSNPYNCGE